MGGLALLAMLALVLLPTSGRLAGQAPGAMAAPVQPAAAEAAGHAHGHGHGVDQAPGSPVPEPQRPTPHEGHADCAYCPLLASVLLAAVPRLPPATGRQDDRWYQPLRTARLAYLHPCGLGSRGPPVS